MSCSDKAQSIETKPPPDTDDVKQLSDEDDSKTLLSSSSSPGSALETFKSDLDDHAPSASMVNSHLPAGWEEHEDNAGPYYWHISSGVIQRSRPTEEFSPRKDSYVCYHDDDELNEAQGFDDCEDNDLYSNADASLLDNQETAPRFVVYPMGCCEFDETEFSSASSSKSIQKCILKLTTRPESSESKCWNLDQSQPILMKLFDGFIQFYDINNQAHLKNLPIAAIRVWAIDDDNNFAFVTDDNDYENELDEFTTLNAPTLFCYVFRSNDDDETQCRIAAMLKEEIAKVKERISDRIIRSELVQQGTDTSCANEDDADAYGCFNELTANVKYIGKVSVSRPTGIDVINVAIDKCLAQATAELKRNSPDEEENNNSTLVDARMHVLPSSIIVENRATGDIIAECRIRYLTFMGISKRDARWCGFIVQNTLNKTFLAYCLECHPSAGYICEAVQHSCIRLYDKYQKNLNLSEPETKSIIPKKSNIRTAIKSLSKMVSRSLK